MQLTLKKDIWNTRRKKNSCWALLFGNIQYRILTPWRAQWRSFWHQRKRRQVPRPRIGRRRTSLWRLLVWKTKQQVDWRKKRGLFYMICHGNCLSGGSFVFQMIPFNSLKVSNIRAEAKLTKSFIHKELAPWTSLGIFQRVFVRNIWIQERCGIVIAGKKSQEKYLIKHLFWRLQNLIFHLGNVWTQFLWLEKGLQKCTSCLHSYLHVNIFREMLQFNIQYDKKAEKLLPQNVPIVNLTETQLRFPFNQGVFTAQMKT